MKKSELQNLLAEIANKSEEKHTRDALKDLLHKINIEQITSGHYKLEKKKIMADSQWGQILSWMQKNPDTPVLGTDFMKPRFWGNKPFIGNNATARLSELKRWGLVEISGIQKGKIKFHNLSANRNLYKITIEGLKFNLS